MQQALLNLFSDPFSVSKLDNWIITCVHSKHVNSVLSNVSPVPFFPQYKRVARHTL